LKPKTTSRSKRAIEYFNRHIDTDIVAILDASSVLEVTEFRFFELAYRDWHGRKASEQQIEKYFAAYMFAERIPSWVRSFARKILRLHAKGSLDPRTFGIWQRLPSARMRFFAKAYMAVLIVIFIVITLSVYSLPEEVMVVFRQCYFPPCY
jgi:hypothetical protein